MKFRLFKIRVNKHGYSDEGIYHGTAHAWKFSNEAGIYGMVIAGDRNEAKLKTSQVLQAVYHLAPAQINFHR